MREVCKHAEAYEGGHGAASLQVWFTQGYTRWTYHGEGDRTREEVVRPRVDGFDDDGGVADMLDDFGHGNFVGGVTEEDSEPTAKAYYDMLDSAQKPLHGHTSVSQLDAIGRVMDFKSRCSMSRQHFDDLLTIIGTLLLAGHVLPKSITTHRNFFVH